MQHAFHKLLILWFWLKEKSDQDFSEGFEKIIMTSLSTIENLYL